VKIAAAVMAIHQAQAHHKETTVDWDMATQLMDTWLAVAAAVQVQ
jgi:hypothetical protein